MVKIIARRTKTGKLWYYKVMSNGKLKRVPAPGAKRVKARNIMYKGYGGDMNSIRADMAKTAKNKTTSLATYKKKGPAGIDFVGVDTKGSYMPRRWGGVRKAPAKRKAAAKRKPAAKKTAPKRAAAKRKAPTKSKAAAKSKPAAKRSRISVQSLKETYKSKAKESNEMGGSGKAVENRF